MLNDQFEIFLADTPESKEIHYSIRYQVYCEEMGFENKDDFQYKKEFDAFDQQDKCVHFIAKNKLTDQWVGAMRLIIKDDELLPIEKNCKLDEQITVNDFGGAVELSRLCLVKDIRRRFKDIDPPHGIEEHTNLSSNNKVVSMSNHQRFSRMIFWGLLHAAVEYCNENRIKNSYFMTTAALARVLARGGLNLINIGSSCQHKGERFPFKIIPEEAYQSDVWTQQHSRGYCLFSGLENEISSVA